MNGLKITADKTENRTNGKCLHLLAGILWMNGFIQILFSAFLSVSSVWWLYGIFSAGCMGAFFWLFQCRYKKWIIPIEILLVLLIFLCCRQMGTDGMAVLTNDFLKYLTGKTGRIYLDYQFTNPSGAYLVAAMLLMLVNSFFVWMILNKRMLLCNLLTAGCVIGCMAGLFEIGYGLVLLCGGLFFLSILDYQRWNTIKASVVAVMSVVAAVGLCVLAAVPFCIKNPGGLSFDEQKDKLEYQIHKKRYDTGADAMPEGNLVNVGAFEKSQETALVLTMEKPQKLYLRGRTGEIYTGVSWEGFEEETYREYEDLFYWLHKEGFYGQAIIGSAYELMGSDTELCSMKIINESACRNELYLPYGLADTEPLSADIIGDDRTISVDIIEMDYVLGSLPQWYELADWLSEHQDRSEVTEYLKKEESYRDFVYENDLQLTNTAVGTMERIFTDEYEEKSLSEILDLIKEILSTELTYDESVLTTNGKNDFARYTLEQSGRGYSVHYATLATLMLRYMGVPARYVEGYYLSADQAELYEPNEEIILTEAHAHAWTEYYMDGVGWIPFEVTPGYIDEEEWDTLSQVLADGKGDGAGKSFTSSDLTYTPPKQPEDNTDAPNQNSAFRFQIKQVLNLLLIISILGIVLFIIYVLWNWLQLKRYKKQMVEAENRECVAELYGYVHMLIERFHLEVQDEIQIRQINEIARFSCHEITDEQRICMEQYADKVVKCCEDQCSIWQKLKYRYILWLF